MRNFNFWLLAVIVLSGITDGQYLGTKTPYRAPHVSYTAAPSGCRPVFVNYVGRHGARFLTKAGADVHVLEVLQSAGQRHVLTDTGLRLLRMVARLCEIEKGQYENITLLGAEEQQAIGERVLYNYQDAFGGRGLDVVVTYKVRTQQSADAFLRAYTRYKGERHFSKLADSLDAILRFYDLSPAYQRYKKGDGLKKAMDSLDRDDRTRRTARAVCRRLFRPEGMQSWKEEELVSFTENLYDLYSVQFSLSGEMQQKGYAKDSVDLGVAFSQEDLAWEDFKSGAADFLEKGPAADPLGVQVKVAAPLLADFIRTMDKAVEGKGTSDAVLRFTHAEAISPFATLLGIPAASVPSASVYRYHDHWQAEAIIPLSANIQWVLYSDGKERLVKILLNEQEVILPVKAVKGPYYRWEDLRAYCLGRLQAAGARLNDNMLDYLKGLR